MGVRKPLIMLGGLVSVILTFFAGCGDGAVTGSNPDRFHLVEVPVLDVHESVEFDLKLIKGARYDLIAELVTADGHMIKDPNFKYRGVVTIEDANGEVLFRADMVGDSGINFRSDANIIGRTEKHIAKKASVLKISDYQFHLSEGFENQNYENIEFLTRKELSKENISNPKFRIFIRSEPGLFGY